MSSWTPLQPPSHTVAAPVAYGCSLRRIRLQADEAAFKEQIASPDGELTGEAYDALLAVHLAQRQSHAVDRAALVAMSESARLKAALGEQLFAAEEVPARCHPLLGATRFTSVHWTAPHRRRLSWPPRPPWPTVHS